MKDFNAWHLDKFGMTFEKEHEVPHSRIDDSMRALSRLLRDYVSEAAAELQAPPALPETMKPGELKPGVKWPM